MIIPYSERYLILIYITMSIIVGMVLITWLYSIPNVHAQHIMMPPAASIGDRKIMSHLEVTPKVLRVGQDALMKVFFVDQNTK
jgi:hypothetical protein